MTNKELTTQFIALTQNVKRLEDSIKLHDHQIISMQKNSLKSGYHQFNCANCGGVFILNDGQMDRRYDKGYSFTCSAGHSNVFSKTT